MQNEILKPVLETDEIAIPRYDLVDPDGSVRMQNVELRLKNEVMQEGTPYDEASVLPAELRGKLGLPETATPAEALNALLYRSGATVGTCVHSLEPPADAGWLKCDGTQIDKDRYPELYAMAPLTLGGEVDTAHSNPRWWFRYAFKDNIVHELLESEEDTHTLKRYWRDLLTNDTQLVEQISLEGLTLNDFDMALVGDRVVYSYSYTPDNTTYYVKMFSYNADTPEETVQCTLDGQLLSASAAITIHGVYYFDGYYTMDYSYNDLCRHAVSLDGITWTSLGESYTHNVPTSSHRRSYVYENKYYYLYVEKKSSGTPTLVARMSSDLTTSAVEEASDDVMSYPSNTAEADKFVYVEPYHNRLYILTKGIINEDLRSVPLYEVIGGISFRRVEFVWPDMLQEHPKLSKGLKFVDNWLYAEFTVLDKYRFVARVSLNLDEYDPLRVITLNDIATWSIMHVNYDYAVGVSVTEDNIFLGMSNYFVKHKTLPTDPGEVVPMYIKAEV